MKKIMIALVTVMFVVTLTACTKENVGRVSGAAAGGYLGSQVGHGHGRTAATIAGTLVGSMIGGSIGRSMDDVDRMKANQALETGRTGQPVTWSNPDNGAQYSVTPTNTYYSGDQPCREYTTTAIIGGERQQIYGKACRSADGNWRIVN